MPSVVQTASVSLHHIFIRRLKHGKRSKHGCYWHISRKTGTNSTGRINCGAGLKEGRAAGLEEARLSMIIQMLKNGMSEEDISRVAGVSQDEIKKAKEMDI